MTYDAKSILADVATVRLLEHYRLPNGQFHEREAIRRLLSLAERYAMAPADDWRAGDTAPKDGTQIRLLWPCGNTDEGHWEYWSNPELTYAIHPELRGQVGEWCTVNGACEDRDATEPAMWAPLEQKP